MRAWLQLSLARRPPRRRPPCRPPTTSTATSSTTHDVDRHVDDHPVDHPRLPPPHRRPPTSTTAPSTTHGDHRHVDHPRRRLPGAQHLPQLPTWCGTQVLRHVHPSTLPPPPSGRRMYVRPPPSPLWHPPQPWPFGPYSRCLPPLP